MTAAPLRAERRPGILQVLVFTVQGVTLGVDASQIDEMLEPAEAEAQGLRVSAVHEKLSGGAFPAAYGAPKVITVRDERGPAAVLIDRPDDITEVKIDSIQPIPPLIASGFRDPRVIWGAVVRPEGVLLLVDFLAGTVSEPILRQREG